VPASTQQRPVYDDEGALVSYEYDEAVRWVAYNPNPSAALEMARTGLDNQELIGQVDAFVPGLGWVRNGIKPEIEHPDQIADPNGTAASSHGASSSGSPLPTRWPRSKRPRSARS
jgi:hypothetical protein